MSEPAVRPAAGPRGDDWRDRLVELHILADHGDRQAAEVAAAWLAEDEHARRIWVAVQRTCDDIRRDGGGQAQPRPDAR